MTESPIQCPFRVGDWVQFLPSERTRGLYPHIESFGVAIGEILQITEIRDDCYLYFASGGGWPWTEFAASERPVL